MLGRKTYTCEEFDHGRTAVAAQLAAYRELGTAPDGFESLFFNNMVLVLDRLYVHRLRVATGKDANALNEVELLAESLMHDDGTLRASTVIKWIPEQTVLGLAAGDPIALSADDFERLSTAFFSELEQRFVTRSAA